VVVRAVDVNGHPTSVEDGGGDRPPVLLLSGGVVETLWPIRRGP